MRENDRTAARRSLPAGHPSAPTSRQGTATVHFRIQMSWAWRPAIRCGFRAEVDAALAGYGYQCTHELSSREVAPAPPAQGLWDLVVSGQQGPRWGLDKDDVRHEQYL
jgi:hypothetical protein